MANLPVRVIEPDDIFATHDFSIEPYIDIPPPLDWGAALNEIETFYRDATPSSDTAGPSHDNTASANAQDLGADLAITKRDSSSELETPPTPFGPHEEPDKTVSDEHLVLREASQTQSYATAKCSDHPPSPTRITIIDDNNFDHCSAQESMHTSTHNGINHHTIVEKPSTDDPELETVEVTRLFESQQQSSPTNVGLAFGTAQLDAGISALHNPIALPSDSQDPASRIDHASQKECSQYPLPNVSSSSPSHMIPVSAPSVGHISTGPVTVDLPAEEVSATEIQDEKTGAQQFPDAKPAKIYQTEDPPASTHLQSQQSVVSTVNGKGKKRKSDMQNEKAPAKKQNQGKSLVYSNAELLDEFVYIPKADLIKLKFPNVKSLFERAQEMKRFSHAVGKASFIDQAMEWQNKMKDMKVEKEAKESSQNPNNYAISTPSENRAQQDSTMNEPETAARDDVSITEEYESAAKDFKVSTTGGLCLTDKSVTPLRVPIDTNTSSSINRAGPGQDVFHGSPRSSPFISRLQKVAEEACKERESAGSSVTSECARPESMIEGTVASFAPTAGPQTKLKEESDMRKTVPKESKKRSKMSQPRTPADTNEIVGKTALKDFSRALNEELSVASMQFGLGAEERTKIRATSEVSIVSTVATWNNDSPSEVLKKDEEVELSLPVIEKATGAKKANRERSRAISETSTVSTRKSARLSDLSLVDGQKSVAVDTAPTVTTKKSTNSNAGATNKGDAATKKMKGRAISEAPSTVSNVLQRKGSRTSGSCTGDEVTSEGSKKRKAKSDTSDAGPPRKSVRLSGEGTDK
jgi:hypothetical protein